MRFLIHFILRCWFRFRVYGTESLNTPGPVLLVPNHVSWLDWAFLYAVLDKDWRFVTSRNTSTLSPLHRWIMDNRRTFPVDTTSPYAARRMAEFLMQGGRLVLFAEGRISTTSTLMKLFEGTGFLIHKTRPRVITAYLRNAVRIPFVRHTGWISWFPNVSVHFSPAELAPELSEVSNMVARRQRTQWLRDRMLRQQFDIEFTMGPRTALGAVAAMALRLPRKRVLEDIRFQPLTYRRLMVGVEALSEQWKRMFGLEKRRTGSESGRSGERIGVLLPNINATPITVLSLWAAGKVPAILNFSSGTTTMLACLRLAGVRHVITSQAFLEKARLDISPLWEAGIQVHFLEVIGRRISTGRKLLLLARHLLSCGVTFREREVSLSNSRQPLPVLGVQDGDVSPSAVVLFTSGSEGVPKGVELSHQNLMANLHQIQAHLDVSDDERFFNAMPLFHSFGLTACTLFPLVRGLYTFLYPSPLHYRVVPAVIYDRGCTVMVGTNTFLNGYARRAHPYDFQAVKYLVAGAEKLQESTATTWAQKFGVRILEGYGATECSPVLAANSRVEPRFGSVGRFLPGIEWKLEPVKGVEEGGRLLVRGPNVMRGYLNEEANHAFQALEGWYDTGDLARIDEDGFVYLLGRLKRFAKISGEMISLTAVEEALQNAFPQWGPRFEIAVVAVADEEKGERLIAFCNEQKLDLGAVRQAIKTAGHSNLCVPRELRFQREIPKLGTGKVDYQALLAQLASESELESGPKNEDPNRGASSHEQVAR